MATATGVGKALPPEIQRAIDGMGEISSLPEITAKIVHVVEDPKATAHEMHEIVRTDPALAAKILRVVNSAFYGLPSQVASLDRAILMLGLSAVKNIALAASLARLFRAEGIADQTAARELWRHSVAVAVASRILAGVGNAVQTDEAFVAGLVHDVGLILSHQLFGPKIRQVIELCHATPQRFCDVEERIVGADHQALGAALAARWRFPPALRFAIACHHGLTGVAPAFQRVLAIVYTADTLCARARYGFWLTGRMQEIPDSLLQSIAVPAERLDDVVQELPERIDEAEQLFAE